MSDLYRSAIGARLAKLPADIPGPYTGDDDDESEETDGLGSLPSGLGPPAMPAPGRRFKRKKEPNPAYSPISGSSFFSEAAQVSVASRSLDVRVYHTPPKFFDGSLLVCHHGAGFSGLTFACMAKEIADITQDELGVLVLDARRHGKTTSTDHSEDLSIDVLVDDFVALMKTLYPLPSAAPKLILVGHSMGGSVLVRACPILMDSKYQITGTVTLDIVEGSAIEALPFMNNLLNARPDGFDSVEDAIEWHVDTKAIRNPMSARVSVPSIVIPSDNPNMPPYVWRTTLRSTAPYWHSWFAGLSHRFLSVRSARLLILAGTDRLDKELMIGQMQGKFQMEVVPGVGHMLHEDNPTKIAELLVDFWRRNDRLVLVGIKKVGEL